MTRPRFDNQAFREHLNDPVGDFAEVAVLPAHQKRALCERLLEEFGVTHHSEQAHGELLHSCPLPNSTHANGDRNPSARLNYEKLTFMCWGCGRSGGLLWFIATCRHSDTNEAQRWLQSETGTGGEEMGYAEVLAAIQAAWARPGAAEPMPTYGEGVLDEWTAWEHPHPMLTADPAEPAPAGLEGRGIPEKTLIDFQVGYAPDYRMRIDDELVTQERIIIPHFVAGRLVGWQARKVDPRDRPKYKNSPGFPKDRTLYNHDRKARRAVVVESPMSVLRHHHHVPELVATFGTKMPERQMRLLRSCDEVVLWFDNDESGYAGTQRLIDGLADHADVLVVPSPFDADVADFDDDTVAHLLRKARPWPLWHPPSKLRPWRGPA